MTSARNISASHTASEIIQLAKHIRRMGVSTVVIGSNIVSIVLDRSDFVLSIHDSSLLIKLCTITSTLGLLTDNDIFDVNV
jgi:D-arabinose 5-phosphate isomerase GutQ